jgi:hypothetical protein
MLRHTIYLGTSVMRLRLQMRQILPALVLLSIGSVAAADDKILLNDTWADGDRTNTNLPTDSATWIGQSSGNGSNSVTPGALNFVVPTNSLKVWDYFTSDQTAPNGSAPHNSVTHLSVGDTLTATMTFTLTGTTAASTSKGFRFGLFFDQTDVRVQSNSNSDSGGATNPWTDATGYAVQFAINNSSSGGNPLLIQKRTGSSVGSLLGDGSVYTNAQTGGTAFSFVDNTSYSARLALTVVSSTQLDVTASILQDANVLSTLTRSDTGTMFGTTSNVGSITINNQPVSNSIYRDFDQLFLRNSSNAEMAGLTFTNWKVTLSSNPPPITLGDANRDGVVDPSDVQSLLAALTDLNGYKTSHNVANDTDLKGLLDMDANGSITNADIQTLLGLFAGTGSTVPVPEPASGALWILGSTVALVLTRLRRCKG